MTPETLQSDVEEASKTIEAGKIYLDSKRPGPCIFDWEKEPKPPDVQIGELKRLSTPYLKSGEREHIDHRVLILNANEYLEAQGSKLPPDLQERVRKNKNKPPIVAFPDFTGGPTMNHTWSLAQTGRKVIMLSFPENKLSDCSDTSIDTWKSARDYLPFYAATLDQLGINTCDAIGWSAGGSIAAAMAANPHLKNRVRKLVLLNSGSIFSQPAIGVSIRTASEVLWWQSRNAKKLDAAKTFANPILPPPMNSEKGIDQGRLTVGGIPQLSDTMRGSMIVSSTTIEKISDNLPVLVVGSSHDRVFPPGKLKKAIEGKDNITLLVNHNRGHSGLGSDELIAMPIINWLDKEG